MASISNLPSSQRSQFSAKCRRFPSTECRSLNNCSKNVNIQFFFAVDSKKTRFVSVWMLIPSQTSNAKGTAEFMCVFSWSTVSAQGYKQAYEAPPTACEVPAARCQPVSATWRPVSLAGGSSQSRPQTDWAQPQWYHVFSGTSKAQSLNRRDRFCWGGGRRWVSVSSIKNLIHHWVINVKVIN